jgi:uncharacterized protein (TIGR04255 family)
MPWKPANGYHAIERATVSILFREALTQHAQSQAVSLLTTKAAGIGLSEIMVLAPPIQFNVVQSGNTPSPIPQVIGPPPGRAIRKMENGRPIEEAILTDGALTFSTFTYRRWADFRARFEALLPDMLSSIASTTAIAEVRLEYWDRFDRQLSPSDNAPLTNQNSILMGRALGQNTGSWHSHIGYFTDLRPNMRTLVNANVDAIASMTHHPQVFSANVNGQARIYSMASVQHTGEENLFSDWQTISTELEKIHHMLKSVLADIIHPDIATAIQLDPQPLVIG